MFEQSRLELSKFERSEFEQSEFEHSELSGASLSGVRWFEQSFDLIISRVCLSRASLSGAG